MRLKWEEIIDVKEVILAQEVVGLVVVAVVENHGRIDHFLGQRRCIRLFAHRVIASVRFHLNLQRADLFIAGIVLQEEE